MQGTRRPEIAAGYYANQEALRMREEELEISLKVGASPRFCGREVDERNDVMVYIGGAALRCGFRSESFAGIFIWVYCFAVDLTCFWEGRNLDFVRGF